MALLRLIFTVMMVLPMATQAASGDGVSRVEVETFWNLYVGNGSGDGEYAAGTEVEVVANEPEPGTEFSHWVGQTDCLENPEAASTVCVMPDADVEIGAQYREIGPEFFNLWVGNGSGDGEYEAGTVVEVAADEPEEGLAFSHWHGNTECLADAEAPVTTCTMPEHGVEIVAKYEETGPFVFELFVGNGSGDGEYEVGTVVEVAADEPGEGLAFSHWHGSIDCLADVEAPVTTCTMPDNHVEIVAKYEETGPFVFKLFVGNGSGDGEYAAGELVVVRADEPEEGYEFERWVGHIDGLRDVEAPLTAYRMPAKHAEIAARYRKIPGDECREEDRGEGHRGDTDTDHDGVRDECQSQVGVITGSWYDPESAGEGLMIHGVRKDLAVAYFYGYGEEGERLWLIGVSEGPFRFGHTIEFRMFTVSGGSFNDYDPEDVETRPWGSMHLHVLNCDEAVAELTGPQGEKRLELIRLADVARSPCNDRRDYRESDLLTGSWYDDRLSGQGLAIHKISDSLGIVYFYGFRDNGENLWLLGLWDTGMKLGEEIEVVLFQVSGGTYDRVDPADIVEEPWGVMTIMIKGCRAGLVTLEGLDGYQQLEVEQLAGTHDIECPE